MAETCLIMKFIVTSTELLKHLQTVSGVLASNNTLPILDNFLFEIDKDSLTISASDLETTMITNLSVKAEETGSIAVPARIVLDYLKTLPEQPLTFTIDEASLGIEISSSYGKSKVAGFSADEFPRNPEMEDSSSVNIPSDVISLRLSTKLFLRQETMIFDQLCRASSANSHRRVCDSLLPTHTNWFATRAPTRKQTKIRLLSFLRSL
jgi:hypothetical protein